MCQKIIRELSDTRIVIVSGLAHGIDSVAHRAALDVGLKTVAFPGSGIEADVIYPKNGRRLAEEIIQAGGSIISQFPPDAATRPWMFPVRNHLMAAISQITLVIEAAEKSGTLITAHAALEYGRTVAAIPGPVTSSLSAGTNALIKAGAELVCSGNDIKELLDLEQSESHQLDLQLGLASDEKSILNRLGIEPCTFDQISQHINKSPDKLLVLLSELELRDLIKNDGGIFYKKI